MRPSVHQTGHELMREMLRDGLLAAAGGGELGSVQSRASAALYVLLGDHPVDRRGRCRSCRRPGAVVGGRRRRCRVHRAARFYLYQPEQVLLGHLTGELSQLAGELSQDARPPSGVGSLLDLGSTARAAAPDHEDTEVLARVAVEPIDVLTEHSAISYPGRPPATSLLQR